MHASTKLKVHELRTAHRNEKTADLSHHKDFKSLNQILEKQRDAENKAKQRLVHLYGPDHAETQRYNEEEHARRQREQKKEELRALL